MLMNELNLKMPNYSADKPSLAASYRGQANGHWNTNNMNAQENPFPVFLTSFGCFSHYSIFITGAVPPLLCSCM